MCWVVGENAGERKLRARGNGINEISQLERARCIGQIGRAGHKHPGTNYSAVVGVKIELMWPIRDWVASGK